MNRKFDVPREEFYRLLSATKGKDNFFGDDFDVPEDKPADAVNPEHTFVETVRKNVLAYRCLSAANFDLDLTVTQTNQLKPGQLQKEVDRSFKLGITIRNFVHEVSAICRPMYYKRRGGWVQGKNRVQVKAGGKWIKLQDYLQVHFPSISAPVSHYIMQGWWEMNGKTFKWSKLPDELKVQVLQNCVTTGSHVVVQFWEPRSRNRGPRFLSLDRHAGPWNVTCKLTSWIALLKVSRQVRSIVLDLCLKPSRTSVGFSVHSYTTGALLQSLEHLGSYYQMVEPYGLPINSVTAQLASTYRYQARLFPELKRFATYLHAIREIDLSWPYDPYMEFFKVAPAAFGLYYDNRAVNYKVLEELPHLNHITIRMPRYPFPLLKPSYKRYSTEIRLDLFHKSKPCVRVIQRLIYERVAKVLAVYKTVQVFNLIDQDESDRFEAFRDTAVQELFALNEPELKERAANGKDGETLNQPDWEPKHRYLPDLVSEEVSHFVPPMCECEPRCDSFW